MKLGTKTYYKLIDVEQITGENRNLINFLIKDRRIPVTIVGTAKLLDQAGLDNLKIEIAEFRSTPAATA